MTIAISLPNGPEALALQVCRYCRLGHHYFNTVILYLLHGLSVLLTFALHSVEQHWQRLLCVYVCATRVCQAMYTQATWVTKAVRYNMCLLK